MKMLNVHIVFNTPIPLITVHKFFNQPTVSCVAFRTAPAAFILSTKPLLQLAIKLFPTMNARKQLSQTFMNK